MESYISRQQEFKKHNVKEFGESVRIGIALTKFMTEELLPQEVGAYFSRNRVGVKR